jgi:hypothetical protein
MLTKVWRCLKTKIRHVCRRMYVSIQARHVHKDEGVILGHESLLKPREFLRVIPPCVHAKELLSFACAIKLMDEYYVDMHCCRDAPRALC